MPIDEQLVRESVRRACTNELLDSITLHRQGMEPEALPIIEEELLSRGITPARIEKHRVARRSEAEIASRRWLPRRVLLLGVAGALIAGLPPGATGPVLLVVMLGGFLLGCAFGAVVELSGLLATSPSSQRFVSLLGWTIFGGFVGFGFVQHPVALGVGLLLGATYGALRPIAPSLSRQG